MKLKRLWIVILLTGPFQLSAQDLFVDFDEPWGIENFIYRNDSTLCNKPWQIGRPGKSKFQYEAAHKRVLCTDTTTATSAGDTFSLVFPFMRWAFGVYEFSCRFQYRLDGDSNDFARVELSTDSGKSWVDLIKEDTTYDIRWKMTGKPVLNGSVDTWRYFYADMTQWANRSWNPKYPKKLFGVDSVLFRFSYIRDTAAGSDRDGWMIDNLNVANYYESIQSQYTSSGGFSLYPNPATDLLYLHSQQYKPAEGIDLYNAWGQKVLNLLGNDLHQLDISALPPGVYSAVVWSEGKGWVLRVVRG